MEDKPGGKEELGRGQEGGVGGQITYCVTGATGYVGSWLVKSLLDKGYRVHATVRDPEKAWHFLKKWEGGERLRLFRADLFEEGSFDDAVRGCHGVFHVAATMQFSVPVEENVESHVQTSIIKPAIKGTLNVLKACLKSNSVRRVVFTSSISTITSKNGSGKWRDIVDESCKIPMDQVWKNRPSGWVYLLAKLLTEEAAFQFTKENGIDLVSVISTAVAGPFLTPTVPTSIQVLLSPLTGDGQLLPIVDAVNARMGLIPLAHIDDVSRAHIFLMEHSGAEGPYICCSGSSGIAELIDCLIKAYPFSNLKRPETDECKSIPVEISTKKLRGLGFEFKHDVQDIIHRTVEECMACEFLKPSQNNHATKHTENIKDPTCNLHIAPAVPTFDLADATVPPKKLKIKGNHITVLSSLFAILSVR
ncbi:OLC1v1022867C1 [Oldenlandia corymbosa var. corymbosa]|uniref:Dihydroflavonol 4-reductase n=1 Tax=Oldenlandia corymbosa var. corymbosa TaxID=529605 RepID=A0AAV1BYV2_OLDCO|nr:OLC1v1022867C1 [Oldenlandia corymbosa var. corymbosa]